MKIEELWETNKRYTDGNFKGYTIRKNDFIKLITEAVDEAKIEENKYWVDKIKAGITVYDAVIVEDDFVSRIKELKEKL